MNGGQRLPAGIDPLGVPRPDSDRHAFVLIGAVVVATLALIFTLGWVVFHQLTPASPAQAPTDDGVTSQSPASSPTSPP